MTSALNICLVTEELSSIGSSGGIGGAFYELAVVLAQRHHVDIVYCPLAAPSVEEQAAIRDRFIQLGIHLRFLKSGAHTWNASTVEARSYEVFRELSECGVDYDVIHFHEFKGLGFYSIAARNQGIALTGARLVVQLHGPTRWTMEANDTLFTHADQVKTDFMERECIRGADYAISPSAYLLDWLRDNGWELPPDDRCLVIKNVCKGLQKLPAVRRKTGTVPGERLDEVREIILFGRHEYRKGFSVFCDSLDLLRDKLEERNVRVTFLGAFGTISDEFSGLILARRGRRWQFPVSVLPAHNRDQASHYLAQAHEAVVVVPSRIENSPYTVLEAAVWGRPVITSSEGGAKELLASSTHAEMTCQITAQSLADTIERALDKGIAVPEIAEPLESTETRWLEFHETVADGSDVTEFPAEDEPLVSVGITHFERPAKLVEAINSIARQTYGNIELIVVDDGSSSKETVEALESIEVLVTRLGGTLIRRENGYLGAARNTAAAAATGEYLCFLDDDDIALPEMVETLVKAAQNSRSDLVNCLNIFMPESRRQEAWPIPSRFHNKISYLPLGGPLSLTPIQNCLGAATALISRRCFDAIGGYTELRNVGHEDYEFFLRALQAGFQLTVCPVPLYLYEVDRPSMVSSTSAIRNFKRVVDAVDVNANPRIWHDFLLLNSGQHAAEWAENRRNYSINLDENAELLRKIATEQDTQKRLLLLSDYANEIGSREMAHVFRQSYAHYQAIEVSGSSVDQKTMKLKQILQPQNASSNSSRTAGLNTARIEMLLGRPDRATDSVRHRIEAQGFLMEEDIADVRTLLREDVSRSKISQLSEVILGSYISQAELEKVLLLVFLLAVKSGNERLSIDTFGKILEGDQTVYLERNSDVAKSIKGGSSLSPVDHFTTYGQKEGRDGFHNIRAAHDFFLMIAEKDEPLAMFIKRFRDSEVPVRIESRIGAK